MRESDCGATTTKNDDVETKARSERTKQNRDYCEEVKNWKPRRQNEKRPVERDIE